MYQSTYLTNGNIIFVFDLGQIIDGQCLNPICYLKELMDYVKIIENIYPNIFKYRFNGSTIEILAIIPANQSKLTSVFGRYGGHLKFYKMLRKYLLQIINTNFGTKNEINKTITKIIIMTGVKQFENSYYSTFIEPNDSPVDIIRKSSEQINTINYKLNVLDMKFWVRELNPDIMDYRKKSVIRSPKEINYSDYPDCISNIMKLKDKTPKSMRLLMKYLLLLHKRDDAKMVLLECLTEKETNRLEKGSIDEQWTNAVNTLEFNMEPTCRQLKKLGFCSDCGKVSPYEWL